MAGPKKLEILISEEGNEMRVIAHNFQGKGCEAVVREFASGTTIEAGPTAEYFQTTEHAQTLKQDQ